MCVTKKSMCTKDVVRSYVNSNVTCRLHRVNVVEEVFFFFVVVVVEEVIYQYPIY